MNAENEQLLQGVYSVYNNVFKPALAEVEVYYAKHPLPIFNEIRSFNDHIARCYDGIVDDAHIKAQLTKAMGHIERGCLDCYKYSVVYYDDRLRKFERTTKRRGVDLTLIDNGVFYIKYCQLATEARKLLKESKRIESKDKTTSFNRYQDAKNKHEELSDFIDANLTKINWAAVKTGAGLILKLIGFLIVACISGIVSQIFGFVHWDKVIQWLGL